jgi:hypothetical protein
MRFTEHERSDMVDLVDGALAAYAKARDKQSPRLKSLRSMVP